LLTPASLLTPGVAFHSVAVPSADVVSAGRARPVCAVVIPYAAH